MPSFIAAALWSGRAYNKAPPHAQFGSVPRYEVIHRRQHPASTVRHSGQLQRHFDGGDGTENHRLVQISEMADAKNAAAQSVKPAAKRDIELVEAELTHLVRVVAVRQLHGGDRIGLSPRVDGDIF